MQGYGSGGASSYLKIFHRQSNVPDQSGVSVVASSISDPDQEAKFTHLRLNSISAQAVINSLSNHVQALNLSHNRIEQLPRSIPPKVVGLNLSFNLLTSFKGMKSLSNLIELNVSSNNIDKYVLFSYYVIRCKCLIEMTYDFTLELPNLERYQDCST